MWSILAIYTCVQKTSCYWSVKNRINLACWLVVIQLGKTLREVTKTIQTNFNWTWRAFCCKTFTCPCSVFGEAGDDINGAVVQVRKKCDRLQIWTGNYANEDMTLSIGRTYKTVLKMEDRINIQYQSHKDSITRVGSTCKARFRVWRGNVEEFCVHKSYIHIYIGQFSYLFKQYDKHDIFCFYFFACLSIRNSLLTNHMLRITCLMNDSTLSNAVCHFVLCIRFWSKTLMHFSALP